MGGAARLYDSQSVCVARDARCGVELARCQRTVAGTRRLAVQLDRTKGNDMNDDQPSVYFAARCLQLALAEHPGSATFAYQQFVDALERETGRHVNPDFGCTTWQFADRHDSIGRQTDLLPLIGARLAISSDGSNSADSAFTATLYIERCGARFTMVAGGEEAKYVGTLDEAVRRFTMETAWR